MKVEEKLEKLKKAWYLTRELRNVLNDLHVAYGGKEADEIMTKIINTMRDIIFKEWCNENFKYRVAEVIVNEKGNYIDLKYLFGEEK